VWLLNPKCSVIWCTLIAELCFTTSLQYYTEENQTRAIPNFLQSERLRTHLSEKSNSKEIKRDGRRYGERLNGGVEVPPAAFRGWEPEPDGLAARHEKDYEGGDGEEGPDRGFRCNCCCVRQWKWDGCEHRQASEESASRPGGARFIRCGKHWAKLSLGPICSWSS
jgi:hypothetical protein